MTATSITGWAERIRSGDIRALARAITAIENAGPDALPLLKELFPNSGKAQVLGITGAPGAGKSTLVDQLAREYRRQGQTIGIVAVDPTSPFTGGAILGDRIRMQAHHSDDGIYIRSMATRGFLGGLARTTADVATVLDASGKDIVMVETVGVGQDEIDIVRLADVTIVILVPGMGDDVQTIKAGIMEIADIFVINKSDHEGADRIEREIRAMQTLATRTWTSHTLASHTLATHTLTTQKNSWIPPIVNTVASEGKGIGDLAAAIRNYQEYLQKQDLLLNKKVSSWRERLIEMLREALLQKLMRERLSDQEISHYAAEIAQHRRDPYSLVEEIVSGSIMSLPAHEEPTWKA